MKLDFIKNHFSTRSYVYMMLVILAGLMSFYYFVYVPNNERDLNQHFVRLLHNKAKTVVEKHRGFTNAINSAPRTYLLKWIFATNPLLDEVLVAERSDTLWYANTTKKVQIKKSGLSFKHFTKSVFNSKGRTDPSLVAAPTGEGLSMWRAKSGNVHIVYEPGQEFYQVNGKSVAPARPYLWVNAKLFIANQNESSFFEDLFLVADQKNQASDSKGFVPDGKIIDQSRLGFSEFLIPDDLRNDELGLFSKTINGTVYKIYFERIALERNLNMFLIGIVSEESFHQLAREVPNWFLIFCLIGALSLIFLLPVLKLLTMSQQEQLQALDARLSVFSLTLSGFLVMTLVMGVYILSTIELPKIQSRLEAIAKQMAQESKREIDSVSKALQDSSLFNASKKSSEQAQNFLSKYPDLKFNEVLEIPITNERGLIKNIFYSDSNRESDLHRFPVAVGNRDYFKVIQASERNANPIDYYIQAINSFATGQVEIAVSTYHKASKNVRVITAQFKSLVNATIPEPYKFVITDQRGSIKLKWDGTGPQGENFIEECNNDINLKLLIGNKSSGHVDFKYVTTECRGFVTPILNEWTLIVFYEFNETLNLGARIFALCLLSLVLVALFTGIIHISLLLDHQRPPILKARTFFYRWLAPHQANYQTWYKLILLNVCLILPLLTWMYWYNDFVLSIFLVFICITTFYLLSYITLKGGSSMTRSTIGLVALLVILILLFLTYAEPAQKLFLGVTVLVLVIWMALGNTAINWIRAIPRIYAYRAYLFSAMLLMSAVPACIFITVHYRHESMVQGYFYLLGDLQKRQVRSALDNPNRLGFKYFIHTQPDSSFIPIETAGIDFLMYKSLRRFQVEGKQYSIRHMGLFPQDGSYTLTYSDYHVQIQSKLNLVNKEKDKDISGILYINPVRLKFTADAWVVYFIMFGIFGLGMLAVIKIPDKIFFRHFDLWPRYPNRNQDSQVNILNYEFENDDKPLHPLYQLPQKAELELAYQQANTEGLIAEEFNDHWTYKILTAATPQYQRTWNTLTPEEQYFLYDLAVDGIANMGNRELIGALSVKGLIRLEPTLEIVNASFANFILHSISPAKIKEVEKQQGEDGQWSRLRPMLVIIIIATFGFLSVSNAEFLGRATALLASIGVVIPNIIGTLSSITNLFGKK